MIGMTGRQVRTGKRTTYPGQELTSREVEVARRLCQMDEPTIPVVAKEFGIHQATVHNHLSRIYIKLGVRTRLGMYRMMAETLKIDMRPATTIEQLLGKDVE